MKLTNSNDVSDLTENLFNMDEDSGGSYLTKWSVMGKKEKNNSKTIPLSNSSIKSIASFRINQSVAISDPYKYDPK